MANSEFNKKPTLLIAEDQQLLQHQYKRGLMKTERFDKIYQASNGQQALDMALQFQPDLIMMDINMPVMDGIQSVQEIKKTMPHTKIMMVTCLDFEDTVKKAFSLNVDAYCLKSITLRQLVSAIDSVLSGAIWLDSGIARFVLEAFVKNKKQPPAQEINLGSSVKQVQQKILEDVLTPREIQVLRLIGENKSNEEIAQSLSISSAWIDGYIRKMIEKLSVDNEIEALRLAVNQGLIKETKIEAQDY